MTEIAISDKARKQGSNHPHNNAFLFTTGISVVKTSEGFTTYIPYKSDNDFKSHHCCENLYEHRLEQKEEKTIEKLGKNIAHLTGLTVYAVGILLYDDKGIPVPALHAHQDRDTDYLGFGVLMRENNCNLSQDELSEHEHSDAYQRLGLIDKQSISDFQKSRRNIDSIEKLEQLTDKKGAGYFINQNFEKDGKAILHDRTNKICRDRRVVCVLRIVNAEKGSRYYESLRNTYLSDPEIAKALLKKAQM